MNSLFHKRTGILCFVGKPNDTGHGKLYKGYASVAEAVSSSTDVEEDAAPIGVKGYGSVAEAVSSTYVEEDDATVVNEIRELLEEMKKEEQRKVAAFRWKGKNSSSSSSSMTQSKYQGLRRRQVKIETEVWEEAAKEYRELLMDMCEQKLAPNLPYMKSLFLGWFEPLRDAIAKEQELYQQGKNKTTYAPYFDQLPADKMAVITMHKLMGLLMSGSDRGTLGTARVVHAVCSIGDAIEQEVGILHFSRELIVFV